ncbi:unnamed protein product [Psylliodes chrysocephalus]|uniref:Uncharacterized protein n=1 Tax=Psylliodes chrysocephalus TaxID=3402493 RepID=A0A9P0CAY9_9CUCU|nr:unnamed protein product [Psylliodes chrysocephala]
MTTRVFDLEPGKSLSKIVLNKREVQSTSSKNTLILGDEAAINLNKYMRQSPGFKSFNIQSIIKPGGNFDNVLKNVAELVKTFSLSDFVIVVAGANDFHMSRVPKFRNICSKLKLCTHTNFIMVSVPILRRHSDKNLIKKFNLKLDHFLDKLDNYTEGRMLYVNINSEQGAKLKLSGIIRKISVAISNSKNVCKNLKFINTVKSKNTNCNMSTNLGSIDLTGLNNFTVLPINNNNLDSVDLTDLNNLILLPFDNSNLGSIDLTGVNNLTVPPFDNVSITPTVNKDFPTKSQTQDPN